MADVEYRVTLDDREVLSALKRIDKNLDKLARDGDRSFNKVGKSAKVSGVQIGAVSGVVQELTRRFINMAEQAARAFLEIAKGGVELNKALELLQIRVTNVLEGNEVAARAFLANTRQAARELKLDYVELAELATTILPDAKDLEVSAKLAGQTLLLARAIGADAKRARISIVEALAGQFVSIRRVLNLSSQQVNKIKELSPEIGRAAAISQVLGERLETIGFNAEDIAKSFTGLFGLIEAEAKDLQRTFAAPIFEELKEQAVAFLEVLDEHRDDIERVAIAFGELAASVLDLVGSNLVEFLDSIDFEQIEATADALNDSVAALDALVAILDAVPDVNQDLEDTRTIIEALAEGLRFAAQSAAILKAFLAGLPDLGPLLTISTGGTPDPERLVKALRELGSEGVFNQEAYNESLRDSARIIQQLDDALKENEENTRKRRQAVEEDADAALADAQALLDQQAALDKLAEAEEAAAEAREKLSKKLADIAIDRERKLADLYRDQARELFEDELEFAQKREDLARQNADKIEDIWRDHQDDLADAARDLTRDEEDIYRDAARDRVEADRDSARARLDIETEYRRELLRIRLRFEESAQEAERRNDAQAFLEAVRRRDRELQEAKLTRSEQLEDASQHAAEQREKVREQLEHELEDARINNRRKLEDLKIRLERELEEQRLNYQRDLEEQALNEERKRAERLRAHQQELEDFARKEAQRLQDLQQSLSAEFELVRKYEDMKREYRVQSAQRAVAEVNAALARLNPFGGAGVPRLTQRQQILGLQEGGPVEAGRAYVVGERGPELFVPARTGQIVPQVVTLPAPAAATQIANDNSRSIDVGGINVGEDMFSSPVATRKLRNAVLGILAEAL